MQKLRTGQLVGIAGLLATSLLASCDLNPGPVVGDWTGIEETISSFYFARVELILDGTPGSTEGTYHYVRLLQEDIGPGGSHELRWTDHWTSRPIVVDGRTLSLVYLDNLPPPHLPNFIRTEDNLLVPIVRPDRPDLSRDALTYALHPMQPGTFGYGRP